MLVLSCEKDTPDNPYDNVDYGTGTTAPAEPDTNSITGLQKNIFSTRCSKSGCHDGTFEPDFRTIESTYATLVFQPTVKNTVDLIHYFNLRVRPFYADSSFLIERLVTTTSDYMPSNGDRLSQSEIQHVKNWINNGARNQFGVVPVAPNLPPVINGFVSADSIFRRLDTTRVNNSITNPFIVHPAQTIFVAFLVSDDSTALQNLLVNQLKLSTDPDDFNSAVTLNAVYYSSFNAWLVTVPTTSYSAGTIVYMRYYVKDPDHSATVEFPRTDSPLYYKTYSSFIIQ